MAKERKIPMRMCLCCREMKPKKELTRVVLNKEGEIKVDPIGKAPGRGAYLCNAPDCIAKLQKTRALDRGFSRSVPDEVYQQLVKELMGSAE
ncbi:MAG: YlxR family protein [Clostridia bacterium]|nr:YlxR family protein [Clostridia bacterium]